jgi:hypothetical protein
MRWNRPSASDKQRRLIGELDLAKCKLITSVIVDEYTFIDELLAPIITLYFFGTQSPER